MNERDQPSRQHHILLVEDEKYVAEVQVILLDELGYAVTAAPSAERALDVLRSGAAIDILVTDINLPGMDGLSLARETRILRPGLPVLFVTGLAAASITEPLAPGMRVFSKTAPIDDFYAALAAMLKAGG